MRPIWSGSITFGLISVPVQLHSALNYNDVSFNLLHKECKSRIKQQIYCPTCDRTVERETLVKGYECVKDQYVIMEGRALELAPAKRPPAKVLNLMDALKRSVMQTSKAKRQSTTKVTASRAFASQEKKRKKA